jgi:membrane protease YdiL (CAAX protease family)
MWPGRSLAYVEHQLLNGDMPMTTLTPARETPGAPRAAPRTTLRHLVWFFGVAFAATWVLFLPFALGAIRWGSDEAQLLQALGVGAPTLSAFVITALIAGRQGVGRLLRLGIRWRVGLGWYVFVVAGPGVAVGAGLAVSAALGGQARPFSFSLEALLAAVVVGLLAGLFEEFGWMGFAFPRLQERYGFLWAGAIMGIAVALWHLPFFFSPGTTQSSSSFSFFLLQLIPARIVFGWIFNGTRGSVLLAILFHGSWNAWSEFLPTGPMVANAAGLTETALLCAVVATILLLNRPARRRRGATSAA